MNKCEGCGYVFASSREVFGAVKGPVWCADCWGEELELAAQRELITLEYDRLAGQLKRLTPALNAADEPCGPYWSVYERMSDIDNELDCLTVAYQRRRSVIGRAA